ncbi:hypothetical protein, partial [uncultured Faecalibaculum sp.]|uniref:hypothetical protein n=1 Tax=uncultured Faecalibaculum sp. TaxID=1729681 RepID=UPI002607E9E6
MGIDILPVFDWITGVLFQLHFKMQKKPGNPGRILLRQIRGPKGIRMQNVAAEAEFGIPQRDGPAGIPVKTGNDLRNLKGMKIRMKLIQDKSMLEVNISINDSGEIAFNT